MKLRFAVALLLSLAATLAAQDQDWVRDWVRAQQQRPAAIGSISRIAPVNEPGTPLIVHGRIVPAKEGVIVFAYHTDRTGVYNRPGLRDWRLKGWVKTDAQGRFEFRTIRPGSYPGLRPPPAHIHVTIDGPGLQRRWTEEIEFADDPLLADKSHALPVTTRNGVQHVNYTIRVQEKGLF